jgi:hypothetical protein
MKYVLALIAIIVVAFASTGCAAVDDLNQAHQSSNRVTKVWNQIHVGMSASEVRSILGKPDKVEALDMDNFEGGTTHSETWMYGGLDNTFYSVDLTDGIVSSKGSI